MQVQWLVTEIQWTNQKARIALSAVFNTNLLANLPFGQPGLCFWLPLYSFACPLSKVLVLNVSHENDLTFMWMNKQVTYIFVPIVLHKDLLCYRGKSKLLIGLFIHELFREPLIFFRLLLSNCLNWKFTAMIILHFDLPPQYTYELFHIYLTSFHSS